MPTFTIEFICIAIAVLIITGISEYFLIKLLRARRVGQKILEIGPIWHKAKEGTPFMGGLGFIFAILVVMTFFFVCKAIEGSAPVYIPLALTLAFAVANGAIGFVDDYCKLQKKENEVTSIVLQVKWQSLYHSHEHGYSPRGWLPLRKTISLYSLTIQGMSLLTRTLMFISISPHMHSKMDIA